MIDRLALQHQGWASHTIKELFIEKQESDDEMAFGEVEC